jgi:hypothetical protein
MRNRVELANAPSMQALWALMFFDLMKINPRIKNAPLSEFRAALTVGSSAAEINGDRCREATSG